MEDLKKIQEFFSKPLNEGKQLDIEDFAKVVQAVTQTGHPVTVLLVPKWNEIEIITGMNAPDDMLRDLSIAVDSLGYGRNDIIIAGDSSNLSRREYSDIRRVNGGHKDYFEESLNEDKEKAINYLQQAIKLSHTNKVRNLILKAVRELGLEVPKVWTESLDENALGFNDSRLSSDQHRDLDYAVRGDSAYTFGNDPYADDQLRYKYAVKMGFLEEATKEEETEFHAKLDKLVHDTFGKRKGELEENRKLTYNDFVRMVRDDMMAGAAPDERPSEKLVGKRAKAYYNDYLQGANVDDLFEAKKKYKKGDKLKIKLKNGKEFDVIFDKYLAQDGMAFGKIKDEDGEFDTKSFALDTVVEYNTGIYYDPAKERNAPKAKEASKSGLEKVRDFVKKAMKEEEITVDDATEFKLNLKHLLDKHVIQKEDLSDYEEKEADYDDLYSDYLYKMVKEVATEKGYSKFLVSKDNPKGETSGLDTKTMNKILMNVIKDIDETIQLGKQLDEKKLCKAGEAYRKRRMAAGEKSSAYLSGRAVKVCKGQMSGKKKK